MIKKSVLITMTLLLIFTIAVAFVGCSKESEKVNVIDAYSEVMEKVLKHKDFDTSKPMGGEVVFKLGAKELKNTEKLIDLHIKVCGNLNLSDSGKNNNNFTIEILNHKDNDKKLLGFYADGNYLYIDSENAHYKIENFKLYDILKQSKSEGLSGMTNMSTLMAGLFFDSAEVSGGEYVFYYELGKVFDNIKNLFDESGKVEQLNDFAKALKFSGWDDMNMQLSHIKGRLEFHFSGDKLTNKNWYNESKTHEFFAQIGDMKIINGQYNINFDQLLSGKEWISTKLFNFSGQGELHLKSSGAIHAKYTWELHTNLDMFELMANGGDFNMDKDDMAHFVIRNNIAHNSKEFNQSRINAKSGVIFELAYDPNQLGTNNVLMAVNLKALLPNSLGKDMGVPSVALNMIPDYYGMYIDNDIFKEIFSQTNTQATPFSKIVKNCLVNLFKNGLDLSAGALDKTSEQYKMINMVSKIGDKNIDNIDFKIEKLVFADMANKEYKLSEHFLGVANQETAERKDFGENLGFIPSKASAPLEINGKAYITLSDGTKISANDKLTEEQLNKIVGGSIEYTYIGFDNKTYTSVSPVKIIGYSGLKKDVYNQQQTIKLITSPPDGKNLISFLTAINLFPPMPTNVYDFNIMLTK